MAIYLSCINKTYYYYIFKWTKIQKRINKNTVCIRNSKGMSHYTIKTYTQVSYIRKWTQARITSIYV